MRQLCWIVLLIANCGFAATLDIERLALALDIDVQHERVAGRAQLSVRALQDLDVLALDASHLVLDSVQVDGEPAAARADGDRLLIDRGATAGQRLVLTIDYSPRWRNPGDPNQLGGSTGLGLRFFGPSPTEPRERLQLWTSNEPGSARHWFPTIEAAHERFEFELVARVASPLRVFSVGKGDQGRDLGDGRIEYRYVASAVASHQVGLLVGDYRAIPSAIGGIEHYAYPDEVDATIASVERFDDMLRYFESVTGAAFPQPEYRQVFVQDLPWGIALPGLALQSENMVDDARTHADYLYLWDGLQAQSLAAQWFGNHLEVRDWRDLWLVRGFAHHLDGLYTEHKNGRHEYLLWNANFDRATVLADWQNGVREALRPASADPAAFAAGNTANLRGGLVLNLLRDQLGDAAWRRVIRRFVAANAGRAVRTDDLIDAIEDETGQRMDPFFAHWVYAVGQPELRATKSYDAARRELTLRIEQRQALPVAAAMDIEIDSRIERIQIAAEPTAEFRFKVEKAPRFVNIDVERAWIKTLDYAQDNAELFAQARLSTDVVAQREAFVELVGRARSEGADPALAGEVEGLLRELMLGDGYWRLRYLSVLQLGTLLGPDPLRFQARTERALLRLIANERAWLRNGATLMLGRSRQARHAELYRSLLDDDSDRVINAAAIALGQSGAPGVFDSLRDLASRPSWKQQSLISALYGMAEAKDPQAIPFAVEALTDAPAQPRWTLATPIWDYRLSAARTLAALGAGERGTPVVRERLTRALADDRLRDVFNNLLLLATLADPGSADLFAVARKHYAADEHALRAIDGLEAQYRTALEAR